MRQLTLPKGSWTFFRQWLRNPARTAAVTPSGRDLAAAMVAALPEGARRVIELGGGTGAITRALRAAFACLREGGRFLQFTYGPQSPLAADVAEELGLEVERGEFLLLNVPPATVYVLSRRG